MLYKNNVLDTSVAFLSKRVFAMWMSVPIRTTFCPSSQREDFLHAVHGVVWHQSERGHLSRYTGRRKHSSDVGGRVDILAVLHFVWRTLPVDMEASDTGVGGQNIPQELREWKRHWWNVRIPICGGDILTFSPTRGSRFTKPFLDGTKKHLITRLFAPAKKTPSSVIHHATCSGCRLSKKKKKKKAFPEIEGMQKRYRFHFTQRQYKQVALS